MLKIMFKDLFVVVFALMKKIFIYKINAPAPFDKNKTSQKNHR